MWNLEIFFEFRHSYSRFNVTHQFHKSTFLVYKMKAIKPFVILRGEMAQSTLGPVQRRMRA